MFTLIIHTIIIGAETRVQIGIPMCVGWSLTLAESEVIGDAITVVDTVDVGMRVHA